MTKYYAIPRMHKEIPNIIQEKYAEILLFNPFVPFNEKNNYLFNQEDKSEALEKKEEFFKNTEELSKTPQKICTKIFSQEEAREYFTDLKRISREQVDVFSKENIAYAQLEQTLEEECKENKVSYKTSTQHASFSAREAQSLANFLKENSLHKEEDTLKIKDTLKKKTDKYDLACEEQHKQQNFSLLDLQKYLLLGYLQEEQEAELFVLEKSILEQEQKVQSFFKNPLEDTCIEMFAKGLDEKQKAAQEELLKSFAFNIAKDKNDFSRNTLKTQRQGLAFANTNKNNNMHNTFQEMPYRASWQEIFSAQLPFLDENTVLYINDDTMAQDLSILAKYLQNKQQHTHTNKPHKVNIQKEMHEMLKLSSLSCAISDVLEEAYLHRIAGHRDFCQTLHFIFEEK